MYSEQNVKVKVCKHGYFSFIIRDKRTEKFLFSNGTCVYVLGNRKKVCTSLGLVHKYELHDRKNI